MRRIVALFTLIFALSGIAFAQMTDDQVVQYVKSAHQAGQSKNQIISELLSRGVTKEQAERIQRIYLDGQGSGSTVVAEVAEVPRQREREVAISEARSVDSGIRIYGHDIFTKENLTFEPNVNLATPENYRLGPGDEVIIDVWGASETTIRQTISPEGVIMVNNIGPVYLSGKTVKEANRYLKDQFARIYAGIMSNEPTTQVKLTLGEIRSIQVNVMGEVRVPGTYTLSSFASVFHALYQAGGVNSIGSLRSIKVVRNGKVVADLDVYDFLMKGKMKDDTRLQDNDVILVDPYQSLVQITGKVKRPMYYELKANETLESLLRYSGGFTGDAYKKALRVNRKSGRELQIFNVEEIDYATFRMDDGDIVSVESVLQRYENRVEIRGAIYRPGLYQIDESTSSVKSLIEKAEGLRGDAFLNRALIRREREDLTHEMIPVDISGIINGTSNDIMLQKNDVIYIPSIHDLQQVKNISIHGHVANPGTYGYSDYMTIEDLIVRAGGLLESAATTRIEVFRRIKDSKSTEFTSTLGETFLLDLKDGYLIDESGNQFYLEPYDEVYVRRSPAYFPQQNVRIDGEVLFSGVYALSKKNERLSDLVNKAGGITPDSYVAGARLIRQMTQDEIARRNATVRLARLSENEADSISTERLNLANSYSVGINLNEALANPGSDADLVLREGDYLYVPEYISTVKISGAVMYPNTVTFKAGNSIKDYVKQAGGYTDDAKKSKAYIVYMNGTIAQGKSGEVLPGCEIIIPSKEKKDKMSTAEILSIGTSVASLATMIATIANILK